MKTLGNYSAYLLAIELNMPYLRDNTDVSKSQMNHNSKILNYFNGFQGNNTKLYSGFITHFVLFGDRMWFSQRNCLFYSGPTRLSSHYN